MTGYLEEGRIIKLKEVGIRQDNYKTLEEMGKTYGASPDDIANLLIEWYYSKGYSASILFDKSYWG